MRKQWSLLWVALTVCSVAYASFRPQSPDSRIRIADNAGNGKLVLNLDLGADGNDFYDGTLEVSDAYLNRRIEALGTRIFMKKATVITGTSRAFVSLRYDNEADGADKLDRYTMLNSNDSNMRFARFEPGQEIRELVIGDGVESVGTVYIQGAPFFFRPIRIRDVGGDPVAHVIRWGLTGKLNQSVQLPSSIAQPGVQFILDNDLRLGDGVSILPFNDNNPFDGYEITISFSNSKFALGGEDLTWRSTVLFEKAQDIELNANLKLDATWLFSGNAMIQGNGNWIDLRGTDADNTGTIGIDRGTLVGNSNTTTIFFRDIKLRLRNGALFTHERTVLDLSNVEIELENTVNFTSGNIHVSGPTMIYAKNYTFSVSHGATMTVDGTVLYYDSGQHYNKQGVFPNDVLDDDKTTMGEALNFQNDGYIQMIQKPEVTLIVSPGGVSGQPTGNIDNPGVLGDQFDPYRFTSDKDKWLSDDVQLIFDNTGNTDNERYYVYNGDNHFLQLAREANAIILHENTRVYLVNTVIKDFDPTAIKLDGSGSSKAQIFFGQGTVLEFGQDVELGTGSDSLYTLTFRLENVMLTPGAGTPGNENIVKVAGQGHRLSLPYASGQSTPGQIVVDDQGGGKGVRLEFEDLAIEQLGGWPRRFELEHNTAQIYSLQHTNTILYRNARLNLSSSYSHTQASMFIDGDVHINTRNNVDTNSPDVALTNTFVFQPARQSTMTFSHNARLTIGGNVTFSLDPIVAQGRDPGSAGTVQFVDAHKSIIFPDDSAMINFNGCTFHVTGTGLYFQKGALNIDNKVVWVAKDEDHGGDAQQRILLDTTSGQEPSVNILSGAVLDIQGPVHYNGA